MCVCGGGGGGGGGGSKFSSASVVGRGTAQWRCIDHA